MATYEPYKTNPKLEAILWMVIVFLAMLFLLISCSPRVVRRTNKATKQLKKLELKYADVWGEVSTETVRIDTVIKKVEIPGETQVRVELDSAQKDSLEFLIRELQIEANKEPIVERITKYITENIEIDPVNVDTLDLHLKIWYDGPNRKLEYSLVRDETHIVAEKEVNKIQPVQYKTVYKIPPYIWAILLILLLIVAALLKDEIKERWRH